MTWTSASDRPNFHPLINGGQRFWLAGVIIAAFLHTTGIYFILQWILLRPYIGSGFLMNLGVYSQDKTWNVLLKMMYFAFSVFLFFWAFEVFLVLSIIVAFQLFRKAYCEIRNARKEKGPVKGFFVGLWRTVPILFEPIFWSWWMRFANSRLEAARPDNPSLSRFFRKESTSPKADSAQELMEDPESDSEPPIVRGVKSLNEREVKRWEGKNIPLPSKDKDVYGLKPGVRYVVPYVLEEHDAFVVGKHWDFRWMHPIYGVVDAVAIPKHKFPKLGQRVGVVKSDAGHGHRVLKNVPFQAEGYGAGYTKTLQEGHAVIWVTQKKGNLHILTDKGEAFAFVKGKGGAKDAYMLVRLKSSPVGGAPVRHRDREMKFVDISRTPEKLNDYIERGYSAEVKHDGAMFWLVRENHRLMLISRRPAHRDGAPVKLGRHYQGIDRIHYVPGAYDLDEDVIPDKTAIQVEVVARGKGNHSSIHAHTAALLNTSPASSLAEQARSGGLIIKLLKVDRYAGKDVRYMDPREERNLRENLGKRSGRVLHVPAVRYTEDGILALYEREKRMGREGLVLRSTTDPHAPFVKLKNKETWDFPITGIAPVMPKHSQNARSHKEITAIRNPGSKWLVDGKPVGAGYVTYDANTGFTGKVGSGLSDDLRRDMWNNPEKYLGKDNVVWEDGMYRAKDPTRVIAWVEVSGMSRGDRTGVVRAPVVEDVRFDKGVR